MSATHGPAIQDAEQAARNARWWTLTAIDRAQAATRHHHPGVRSHLTSALMQLDATITLAQPSMDQVEA